jgi:phage gp29-like protein
MDFLKCKKPPTMTAIQVNSTATETIINIPKAAVAPEIVMRILERIRFEELIQKSDFQEDIENIGEEIKADWWQRNRDKYLQIG